MKKVEKLDLSRYQGYVHTQIEMKDDITIETLLQRIENKLNEIVDYVNSKNRV